MAALPDYIVHGVKYKLSEVFSGNLNFAFELPSDFDLKDPEVLLEELEYDFAIEKVLIASGKKNDNCEQSENLEWPNEREKQKIKLPRQNKIDEYDNSKSASAINMREFEDTLYHVQTDEKKSQTPKAMPRQRFHGGLQKISTPTSQLNAAPQVASVHGKGVSKNKQKLLDELTDLLTDDVKQTS